MYKKNTLVAGFHRASPSTALDKSSKLIHAIKVSIQVGLDIVNGKVIYRF